MRDWNGGTDTMDTVELRVFTTRQDERDAVVQQVELSELPNVLLELSTADEKAHGELVISFPTDEPNVILVEIYNAFRE